MSFLRAFAKLGILLIGLAFAVIVLGGLAGAATPQCAPADQMVDLLSDRYGEAVVGTGLAAEARLMVFAHPEGDTWSIVFLLPDGRAGLMASGADWEAATPTKPGSEI